MAQLNFNAQSVPPSTGQLDALPKGWYNAAIEASELKPTKDGTGAYLELVFGILSGKYTGRKVYARLNLQNSNPITQEIAYKDLSAICHATGVLSVQDSAQLHNIPMKIRLKVRKETEDYEASNDINAYKNINEQVKLADEEGAQLGAAHGVGALHVPPQQQQMPQQMPQQQPPQFQQQAPQMQPQQQPQFQPQFQPQPQYQNAPQAQQPQPQQWQGGAQQPWQQPQQDNPPQMQQYQQPPQQQPQMQQPPQQQVQQQQPPYNAAQLQPNPQQAIPPWQQGQQGQ